MCDFDDVDGAGCRWICTLIIAESASANGTDGRGRRLVAWSFVARRLDPLELSGSKLDSPGPSWLKSAATNPLGSRDSLLVSAGLGPALAPTAPEPDCKRATCGCLSCDDAEDELASRSSGDRESTRRSRTARPLSEPGERECESEREFESGENEVDPR